MARLPDDFFDDEPTQPEIKVPKGWSVAENEDDDDDQGDDGPFVPRIENEDEDDTDHHEVAEKAEMVAHMDEIAARHPQSRTLGEAIAADLADRMAEPNEPVQPKKPKRHAWVEDFDDDDVVTPVPVTLRKKRAFIEDFEDEDDTTVVPTTGKTMVEPEPDEEDEEDITPTPVVPKEIIVPVKRLSEKALLVSLNISQWNGRRFDRGISEEINAQKAAAANAGRFNKVLLPDCAELAEVHRQTSSLRNWFTEKTMPWMNDGARITPSATYLDFTSEFRKREADWTRAVDALIAAYPALRAKAPQQLQSMYNPYDYPRTWELQAKFSMAIRAFPLPDKEDFRVELDPKTMAALKESMADVEGDLARTVVAECYARLGKAVGAMADRLGDPDTVFRNSLTENLAEAVSALRDLNITDDPKLEAMRKRIERTLTGYTADELRNDLKARKTAAVTAQAALADINARMAGLMGTP